MQPAAQLSPGLTCPNVPQPAPGYTVQYPNVKADIFFYLEPCSEKKTAFRVTMNSAEPA